MRSEYYIRVDHPRRLSHVVVVSPVLDTEEDDGLVKFCALGGGFVRRMVPGDFHKLFVRLTADEIAAMSVLVRGEFTGDWVEIGSPREYFPGYHNHQRWNGWAYPWFTRETVLAGIGGPLFFNVEAHDDYFTWLDECEGQVLPIKPREVDTVDGRLVLYDFGALGWCFNERSDY